jgi:Ran GTPase-activating protein (RanGAP) involved in mRNA processing and transport
MPRARSWISNPISPKKSTNRQKAEMLEQWDQRRELSKKFDSEMTEELERCLDETLLQMFDGVEVLSLTGRMLGEAAVAVRVAEAMKKNARLKKLQLDNNRIDDAAMIELADAMCGHGGLQSLDLDYNYISDKGAAAIAKVLVQQETSMREIHLRYNRIGKAGAFVLAKALWRNKSLESLSLHGNTQIGAAGGAEFAKALAANTHLKGLSLFDCRILDAGAEQLARGLKRNHALKHLVLTMCGICDRGAIELATMLTKNQILQGLHLDDNFIGDPGAQSIAKSLEQNRTLIDLQLDDNQLSKEVYVYFADALESNETMEKLGLSSVDEADDPESQDAMKSMRESLAFRRAAKAREKKKAGRSNERSTLPQSDEPAGIVQRILGAFGAAPANPEVPSTDTWSPDNLGDLTTDTWNPDDLESIMEEEVEWFKPIIEPPDPFEMTPRQKDNVMAI